MEWYAVIFKTGDGKMTKRYFLCWKPSDARQAAQNLAALKGWKVYRECWVGGKRFQIFVSM